MKLYTRAITEPSEFGVSTDHTLSPASGASRASRTVAHWPRCQSDPHDVDRETTTAADRRRADRRTESGCVVVKCQRSIPNFTCGTCSNCAGEPGLPLDQADIHARQGARLYFGVAFMMLPPPSAGLPNVDQ